MGERACMTNIYCSTLLILMIGQIVAGVYLSFQGNALGILFLIGGMLLTKGFKTIQNTNPKKIGLLTVLGKRRDDLPPVQGLVLLLDWLPVEVIGVIEYEMQTVNQIVDIDNIRCHDGIRVNGRVSISIHPDKNNLADFDDAGRMDGVLRHIKEQLTSGLQEIAKLPGHNFEWMESNSYEIGKELADRIFMKGTINNLSSSADNHDNIANARGLGIIIDKLQVKLVPISTKLIQADEGVAISKLDTTTQTQYTQMINELSMARYNLYMEEWRNNGCPEGLMPTVAACRKEIFDEQLGRNDRYQKYVNEGGINIINTTKADKDNQ